jgi:hypothetical protein
VSQENVELALYAYELYNRRDLEAELGLADAEKEAHDPPQVPDSAVNRGRVAVMRDWRYSFDSFEVF